MNRNKQFFKKLTVFVILVLAVNELLNVAYNHWMYYFRLSRIQDEEFQAYSGTLKYLMLGNSHNRINPLILGPGFCYIMPKETLYADVLQAKVHPRKDRQKAGEHTVVDRSCELQPEG